MYTNEQMQKRREYSRNLLKNLASRADNILFPHRRRYRPDGIGPICLISVS